MLSAEQAQRIVAAPLMGADDVKLGTVQQVLADVATGEPEWLLVAVGTYAQTCRWMPADQATLLDHRVRVPYSRELFEGAPEAGAGSAPPDPGQAAALRRHFGVGDAER